MKKTCLIILLLLSLTSVLGLDLLYPEEFYVRSNVPEQVVPVDFETFIIGPRGNDINYRYFVNFTIPNVDIDYAVLELHPTSPPTGTYIITPVAEPHYNYQALANPIVGEFADGFLQFDIYDFIQAGYTSFIIQKQNEDVAGQLRIHTMHHSIEDFKPTLVIFSDDDYNIDIELMDIIVDVDTLEPYQIEPMLLTIHNHAEYEIYPEFYNFYMIYHGEKFSIPAMGDFLPANSDYGFLGAIGFEEEDIGEQQVTYGIELIEPFVDINPANNELTLDFTVVGDLGLQDGIFDLEMVSVQASSQSVDVGDQVVFTLNVQNNGNTNLDVDDYNMYIIADGQKTVLNNVNYQPIDAGASAQLISALIPEEADVGQSELIWGIEYVSDIDSNPANNEKSILLTVESEEVQEVLYDMQMLSVIPTKTTVDVDEQITVTITVKNNGQTVMTSEDFKMYLLYRGSKVYNQIPDMTIQPGSTYGVGQTLTFQDHHVGETVMTYGIEINSPNVDANSANNEKMISFEVHGEMDEWRVTVTKELDGNLPQIWINTDYDIPGRCIGSIYAPNSTKREIQCPSMINTAVTILVPDMTQWESDIFGVWKVTFEYPHHTVRGEFTLERSDIYDHNNFGFEVNTNGIKSTGGVKSFFSCKGKYYDPTGRLVKRTDSCPTTRNTITTSLSTLKSWSSSPYGEWKYIATLGKGTEIVRKFTLKAPAASSNSNSNAAGNTKKNTPKSSVKKKETPKKHHSKISIDIRKSKADVLIKHDYSYPANSCKSSLTDSYGNSLRNYRNQGCKSERSFLIKDLLQNPSPYGEWIYKVDYGNGVVDAASFTLTRKDWPAPSQIFIETVDKPRTWSKGKVSITSRLGYTKSCSASLISPSGRKKNVPCVSANQPLQLTYKRLDNIAGGDDVLGKWTFSMNRIGRHTQNKFIITEEMLPGAQDVRTDYEKAFGPFQRGGNSNIQYNSQFYRLFDNIRFKVWRTFHKFF